MVEIDLWKISLIACFSMPRLTSCGILKNVLRPASSMGHILLPIGRAMAAAMQRSRVAEISRTSADDCVSSEDIGSAG